MIQNLRAYAKKFDSLEKIIGTGINIVGDEVFICQNNEWIKVVPDSVTLRACTEMENFPNSKMREEDLYYLWESMVQTIIDVCKEKKLNEIDELSFSIDDLKSSIEYGRWVPASDASLRIIGYHNSQRKLIKELF
jgi:hypothetical protein